MVHPTRDPARDPHQPSVPHPRPGDRATVLRLGSRPRLSVVAAPSPFPPKPPGQPAVGGGRLLPGLGSGVRKSLQATQARTSASKH